MREARWWTIETVFVVGIGAAMLLTLTGTLFTRMTSKTGSPLVPTQVLQDVRDHEQRCNTITDEERGPGAVRLRRC
jgi:hypothetical protein